MILQARANAETGAPLTAATKELRSSIRPARRPQRFLCCLFGVGFLLAAIRPAIGAEGGALWGEVGKPESLFEYAALPAAAASGGLWFAARSSSNAGDEVFQRAGERQTVGRLRWQAGQTDRRSGRSLLLTPRKVSS